jgi:putative Mn2+ efflux pump MntP
MPFSTLILIALGLSMDAFGASISRGAAGRRHARLPGIIKAALVFGGFAALAPILGWAVGSLFYDLIQAFDHWVAFILLSVVGMFMVREGLSDAPSRSVAHGARLLVIIVAAIATSIDAAVFGLTLPMFRVNILLAAGVIGFATFLAAIFGNLVGRIAKEQIGRRAEFLGGLILIAIGVKILIGHVYFAPEAG